MFPLFHNPALWSVAVVGELYHLAAGNVAGIESEAYESANLLPTLTAGSTWIDGEDAQAAIGNHLENMAVTANEYFGLDKVQSRLDARRIAARIAADVSHHHLHALNRKNLGLLETTTQVLTVGIAPHGPHLGTYRLNHVDESLVTNISSMPNLVTVGKMLGVTGIPVAMCVAYDTNCFHLFSN